MANYRARVFKPYQRKRGNASRAFRPTPREAETHRRTLSISGDTWEEVVPKFVTGMANDVGPGIAALFKCAFSTTDATSELASQMVMMDAFQQYFEFELMCICGIPSVRLLGTEDDWAEIRKRVDVIAEYDLQWWTDAVAPICDQLTAASRGEVDVKFWKQIYKPVEAYGGEVATGWITNLFPYLRPEGQYAATEVNTTLQTPLDSRTTGDGISIGRFPNSVCDVPVRVVFPDGNATEYRLMAGVAGAVYDESTQSVTPEIGWAVREGEPIDVLLETIATQNGWRSRTDDPDYQPLPAQSFSGKFLVASKNRFKSEILDLLLTAT